MEIPKTNERVTIRSLTVTELTEITSIHRRAFPESALTALGTEAVERYYEWLLTGPHDAIALGAYHEGRLIGFLFGGIFRGALSGFLQKNRRWLIWRVITHPYLIGNPLFRERLELAVRILFRRPRKLQHNQPAKAVRRTPSFGILAIAVDPQNQGTGAGKALMQVAEETARLKNYKSMNLSVATDNAQAIGFYEHLGWQKADPQNWNGRMFKELD